VIYHFCTRAAWDDDAPTYVPESFVEDRFIHLSDRGTVHIPATALHADSHDLLLLTVDPELVDAPLRWEPGDPNDLRAPWFPHLYGPLPRKAVVRVDAYVPGPDGTFEPPAW
jgi:uncharacterized protein (DUF952 family)